MSKISSCLIRAAFVFCIVIIAACSDNGSSNDAPPDSPDIPIDNTPPSTDFVPPAGIYLLGVRNSISELRDYPFVDGYVLRTGWGMIETAENKYDFSTVDEFIEALDAINQKLTLVIFSQRVPDYVLAKSTVEKYDTPNQNGTGDTYETVVPWDEAALDRYQIFIKALGDHRVMSLEMGVEVALRDHPVLNIIGAQIMGLGGLRDPSDVIANRDSYSREKFTAASLSSLDIVVTEFPKKFVHIALFGISDDNDNPALDDHVVSSIKTEFN